MTVDLSTMAAKAYATLAQAEYDLHVHVCAGTPVMDEVSILFPTEEMLDSFTEAIKGDPFYDHFNSVPTDVMLRTAPKGTSFGVRFEFLRRTTRFARIEAMAVLDGHAPLHQAKLDAWEGEPRPFHMSYKLRDEQAYRQECRRLSRSELEMVAEYRNSYGIFSYFFHPSLRLYVKPRVNTRD